jgi:hypothetical protein
LAGGYTGVELQLASKTSSAPLATVKYLRQLKFKHTKTFKRKLPRYFPDKNKKSSK